MQIARSELQMPIGATDTCLDYVSMLNWTAPEKQIKCNISELNMSLKVTKKKAKEISNIETNQGLKSYS